MTRQLPATGLNATAFFKAVLFPLLRTPVYPTGMDKKPLDNSKNRFAEVIRQSQERRAELNNKARKKQMEDIELPPRDEEIADAKEDDEPAI